MPPLPSDKRTPNANFTWGQMNQAVRNDVPRSLLNAKKSILTMRRLRRRG